MSGPSYNRYSGESATSDGALLCFYGIPIVIRYSFTKDKFGKRFYGCAN
jgi:hypothetical protein